MDRREGRRYEFPVLVAIIGVLAFLLMNALDRVREEFEEAAVQSEVAALRVELMDRLAHHQLVGGALPESRNPQAQRLDLPGALSFTLALALLIGSGLLMRSAYELRQVDPGGRRGLVFRPQAGGVGLPLPVGTGSAVPPGAGSRGGRGESQSGRRRVGADR